MEARPYALAMSGRPSDAEVQEAVIAIGRLGMALTDAITSVPVDEVAVSNAGVITLFHLQLQGPLRPNALADLLGFTSGGATKLVDRLESSALVRRVDGGLADQRAVTVEITEAGRELVGRLCRAVLQRLPEAAEAIRKVAALLDGVV